MQIALTKKLAEAMGIKPEPSTGDVDPLFSWTANWTKVWSDRKTEDMLVLVNNATRFTVAIYQVKRKDIKKVNSEMLTNAIRNTLVSLNLNSEIVDEYLNWAGKVEFVANKNRQFTSWVNSAGLSCGFCVEDDYNDSEKIFDDRVGAPVNLYIAGISKNPSEGFIPKERMFETLSKLTGLPTYKYKALEILVTLDLEVYKATRKLIVPADMRLKMMHPILQSIYNWQSYHLHDFRVFKDNGNEEIARLVPYEDDLDYDEDAILVGDHRISEYLTEGQTIIYTYDMGDYWEHEIELVRVIDDYDKDSPYLLEAIGQAPPEDAGGVGGFIEFREAILDPDHPDHEDMKIWGGSWTPELSEWQKSLRKLDKFKMR